MKKLLFVFLVLLFMVGCNVQPSQVDRETAKKIAEKLTFFQHQESGLCFAVIATRKSGSKEQSGVGMTVVPCEDVKDLLVNK